MNERTTTRRRFLGTAAGATGVALGAAVWGANQAAAAAVPGEATQRLMADKRSFVAGNFTLELDGVSAGFLKDADGGHAYSDVVVEKLGPDHIARKHIGGVKYEDITVNAGLGMSKAFYDWIAASWAMKFQRKSGSIVAADFNMQARSTREFFNALITETTIPAMDASSKDPAFMTIKWAPEYTRTKASSGKVTAPIATQQKMWLPSNFKLQIDGLDCTKVNKIDAFTVKQSIVANNVGDTRDALLEPGTVEFPDLAITFAASSSETWQKWFDDFVIQGNNGQESEKNGTLTFLSPNLQSELGTVKFFNMGIFKLDDDASEDANGNVIQRFRALLYCDNMVLSVIGLGGPKPGPSPTPTLPPR